MDRTLSFGAWSIALSWLIAVAAALTPDITIAADQAKWQVAPVSAWVEPIAPFSSSDRERKGPYRGYDMQLSDRQHRALRDKPYAYYRALEYGFANLHAVAEYSQVSIDFDPTYQSLTVHEVTVLRGDEHIDKLPTLRADLLRLERDLDALIYDGTHSLTLLLSDIRVGDVLRYAYTIDGENPIFAGQRELGTSTSPFQRRGHLARTRIISSASMHQRSRGRATRVTEQPHPAGVETIITPQLPEQQTHNDSDESGSLVFSDVASWSDVVAWGTPLYALDQTRPTEIINVAEHIRENHDTDAERIGAALRWVQDEIRYFGIELGADSHMPASPELTLQRRFADCKGKTLLLIDLLAELNIQSEPALVNTDGDLNNMAYPWRLHAFDHVIVHVYLDDESHYIDPTRQYQRGKLGDFYEPDYGGALILKAGETELRAMTDRYAGDELSVDKTVIISADENSPADMTVTSVRAGSTAERFRRWHERDGLEAIGEDYLSYYQNNFDELELIEEVAVHELDNNRVKTIERYRAPSFWSYIDEDTNSRWMPGDELLGWVEEISDDDDEDEDMKLAHPLKLNESWTVKAPDRYTFDNLEGSLDTPWFHFSKTATLDDSKTEVNVKMQYVSLRGTLEPHEREAYDEAVTELDDLAGFQVTDDVEPLWLQSLDAFVEELDERDTQYADSILDAKNETRQYLDMMELAGIPLALGAIGVTMFRRRRERVLKKRRSDEND